MGIVVAVGTAIATSAVAISSIATVGLTLTTALEVTAAIGATIGAIGVITGNKDLSMAGLALGVIGGVGSLASSAGLLGDAAGTAPLFGSAASDAVTPLADTTSAAEAIGGDAGAAGMIPDPGAQIAGAATAGANPAEAVTSAAGTDVGNGSGDIINSIGQTSSNAALPQSAIANQTAQASGNATDAITGGDQSPLTSALNQPNAATTLPPQQAGIPQAAGTAPSIPGVTVPGAPTPLDATGLDPVTGLPETTADIPGVKPTLPGSAFDQSVEANDNSGILGTLTSFAKNHDLATYGLIQAAGSFAQGAFSPITPAQVNALNAQAAANNAAAGLTNKQVANINSGVPTATVNRPGATLPTTTPMTPVQSPPITGQPQGLINRQVSAAA